MNYSVMIVDDTPFVVEILRRILLETPYDLVAEAKDGEEAVRIARQVKPDIVLMDLIMPKKNGIEATRQIIQELPQTQVIAISTADQESIVTKAIEAGCSQFISKPFEKKDILRALERIRKEHLGKVS